MIELWPFQQTLIQDLRSALISGHRAPLLVSPTGSGKTVMFAYLTSRLAANGFRTMILAHRKELLHQISDTLADFDVLHGIVAPGAKYAYRAHHPVHVASVFTIVHRLKWVVAPDYVIIDEAHHAIAGSTWSKALDHWRLLNPKMRLIGVTATPERLSGEGLDDTFDTLLMGPSVKELIRDSYLAPYRIFAPPVAIDTSGLHRRAGDFIRAEAAALMDKPKITGDAIEHYRRHLNGAPVVAFCVSIEHAHHVAENFRQEGYRAAAVDGTMKDRERTGIVQDFTAGRLNVMTSCDLVSEGFDVPGMMGCINLRPTESLAMCLQQWGRTLRYQDGKTAILLDHVGNSARHGLPDQDRQWSLAGRPKSDNRRDEDDISIRQCGACGRVCGVASRNCPECGAEFEIKARKIQEVAGTLEEIEQQRQQEIYTRKNEVFSARDIETLTQIGRMRGMNNPVGWAGHVLAARAKKALKRNNL
ncbi:MAG: DEAD/DEAH box helicase [Gammaproteobacteria bacterium]|nr:DEAD/DEAH box helicase [Gammaproteobacteria bacterium]